MARQLVTRSDGSTIDLDIAKAETYDKTRKVEKVLIVDSEGNAIGASHALPVVANVTVGDIEIGAVELKDASTDARAPVSATNGLTVDLGSNNDVTVTGSVTANAGTNLNTSALATSSNQTSGSQKTQLVDSSGNIIDATVVYE